MICLEIIDQAGQLRAAAADEDQVIMVFEGVYVEGDQIRLSVPQTDCHYVVRVDDAVDEALVYMTRRELLFEIPFGEKKRSWSPKTFMGERHYLTCRRAEGYEIGAYRNLAENVIDQHGDRGCFPHASANGRPLAWRLALRVLGDQQTAGCGVYAGVWTAGGYR